LVDLGAREEELAGKNDDEIKADAEWKCFRLLPPLPSPTTSATTSSAPRIFSTRHSRLPRGRQALRHHRPGPPRRFAKDMGVRRGHQGHRRGHRAGAVQAARAIAGGEGAERDKFAELVKALRPQPRLSTRTLDLDARPGLFEPGAARLRGLTARQVEPATTSTSLPPAMARCSSRSIRPTTRWRTRSPVAGEGAS